MEYAQVRLGIMRPMAGFAVRLARWAGKGNA